MKLTVHAMNAYASFEQPSVFQSASIEIIMHQKHFLGCIKYSYVR